MLLLLLHLFQRGWISCFCHTNWKQDFFCIYLFPVSKKTGDVVWLPTLHKRLFIKFRSIAHVVLPSKLVFSFRNLNLFINVPIDILPMSDKTLIFSGKLVSPFFIQFNLIFLVCGVYMPYKFTTRVRGLNIPE